MIEQKNREEFEQLGSRQVVRTIDAALYDAEKQKQAEICATDPDEPLLPMRLFLQFGAPLPPAVREEIKLRRRRWRFHPDQVRPTNE